jgi:hypothetical protein
MFILLVAEHPLGTHAVLIASTQNWSEVLYSSSMILAVTVPHQKWGVCRPRSYWGIIDEARIHKHTHKHTIPYMKFKLKLLQIKCHILEFTKDEAQK